MIKKLCLFLVLLVLSGCASKEVMPQQVLVERPIVNTCDTCTQSYTVRTPVQVVYKNTTYTTVYEPKTFTKTSYETVPYNCVEDELCR